MRNILILTATTVESRAILSAFQDSMGAGLPREHKAGKTYYNLGEIGEINVYLAQAEMGAAGPGATILTVRDAITAISPVAVVMVGIAFGLKPQKQKLGE